MKAFVILSCAATVALAQFGGGQLKELTHFQAITEPHLPRDPNVLLATQNFLSQFAELKALADAAPDPIPQPNRRPTFTPVHHSVPVHHSPASVHHSPAPVHHSPHRFAPQPAPTAAPAPPPTHHHRPAQFDVHGEIRSLLNSQPRFTPSFAPAHHAPQPTAAPAPPPPPPTFAPAQHHPVRFPSFSVLSNVGGSSRQTFNTASGLSAGQFTPEVLAAQKHLAAAHENILRQQAALTPRHHF
ncbi:uncharacterized protein LOC127002417 [Eriocheir sinensis]|uniref:uncharacterized protein LOC127002417 n=1 Tax=Eriocheir sinensis TaxID=95602 RepID=UPI0021C73F78|nr:uncharacterized protein LOC127002417 [Eriocheir sinensis]